MAYRNLTGTSKDKLKQLFRDEDGGIQVKDRYYTSFNYGCLEEDEFPRKNPADHFVNIPRDTQEISGPSCPLVGSCITEGIERDLDLLADNTETDENRVAALMGLGHWVGDIHQPLHVSFEDDRGGNSIKISVEDRTCGSKKFYKDNLHAVWDNCLLEAGLYERVRQSPEYSEDWTRFSITYAATAFLLDDTSVEFEREIVDGEPWEWAQESLEITLNPKTGYCFKDGNICKYDEDREKYQKGEKKRYFFVTQKYINDHKEIAEMRVQKAGFRLAHLINGALDNDYTSPIKNSTQVD